jgi:hypothetical protein
MLLIPLLRDINLIASERSENAAKSLFLAKKYAPRAAETASRLANVLLSALPRELVQDPS